MRLKVAAVAVEYYSKKSHPLSAANMIWEQRFKNFQVDIIYLWERKKGNRKPSLLIISNQLSITNFFESYETFAGDYIGQNNYPINWILRDDFLVGTATNLAAYEPYFATHGFVEE